MDVLIYDEIRWYRDRVVAKLEAEGLSHAILEYGKHTQQAYFAALRGARAMAFLCEHETQGLAWEEAMAMNVPVFAWEEGTLVDPRQLPDAAPDLRVSSVPYFDETCGRTFTLADLEDGFDAFWRDLPGFDPRNYVARTLAPAASAQVYLNAFRSMTGGRSSVAGSLPAKSAHLGM